MFSESQHRKLHLHWLSPGKRRHGGDAHNSGMFQSRYRESHVNDIGQSGIGTVTSSWPQIKERQNQTTLFYWFWNCWHGLMYLFIYSFFLTLARTNFSILKSKLEQKTSNISGLDSGSFFIDLAQNTFKDYIFQIAWILFPIKHNYRQNYLYL